MAIFLTDHKCSLSTSLRQPIDYSFFIIETSELNKKKKTRFSRPNIRCGWKKRPAVPIYSDSGKTSDAGRAEIFQQCGCTEVPMLNRPYFNPCMAKFGDILL